MTPARPDLDAIKQDRERYNSIVGRDVDALVAWVEALEQALRKSRFVLYALPALYPALQESTVLSEALRLADATLGYDIERQILEGA